MKESRRKEASVIKEIEKLIGEPFNPESFKHAWDGIKYVYENEPNFRIELAAASMAVYLGFKLKLRPHEWAIISIVVGNVLASEIFNTVVEYLVDHLVGENYNVNAKVVKDAAAGLVLINCVAAVGVGGAIFLPKIVRRVLFRHWLLRIIF